MTTAPFLATLQAARDGRGPWAEYREAADAARDEYFACERDARTNIMMAEAVMREALPETEHTRLGAWADADADHWSHAARWRETNSSAPVVAVVMAYEGRIGTTRLPVLTPYEVELLPGGQAPGWLLLRRDGRYQSLPDIAPAADAIVRQMAKAAGWYVLDWTRGDLSQGPIRLTLHELQDDGVTYADEPEEQATCYGLRHAAEILAEWLSEPGQWDYGGHCIRVRATTEDGSDITERLLRQYGRLLGRLDGLTCYTQGDLTTLVRNIPNCWPQAATEEYIDALERTSGLTYEE